MAGKIGALGIIGLGLALFGAVFGIAGFWRASGTPSSFSSVPALQSGAMVGVVILLLGIAFIIFD